DRGFPRSWVWTWTQERGADARYCGELGSGRRARRSGGVGPPVWLQVSTPSVTSGIVWSL
ncbi:MAG: hypothetical protein ACRDS0_37065, partial [Pseudonocardiaceae bacterium]